MMNVRVGLTMRVKVDQVSHRDFSVRTDIPPEVVLCALPRAPAIRRGSCADATTEGEVRQ